MPLPQTTSEQRTVMYDDVRTLLVPGFISQSVEINGISLAMRSLNTSDFFILKHRVGLQHRENSWKSWLIAMSIWMVDGQIVIGNQEATLRLYEMAQKLPESVRDALNSIAMTLIRRLDKALSMTESYLYEIESRYLWKGEGLRALDHNWFGLSSGSSANPIQKLWVYYNTLEDEREQYNITWTMAKFQIGPHAPKSVEKLNNKDRQTDAALTHKRQEIQDKAYYKYIGVLKEDSQVSTTSVDTVHVAYSVEELQQQMKNWVAGIKDSHDLVVDQVKAKIRHEVETSKQEAIRHAEEVRQMLDEQGINEPALTPLYGEAAMEILNKLNSRSENPGARRVFDGGGHNSAYDKYIRNNPDVGVLRVNDQGQIVSDSSITPDMQEELVTLLKGKPEEKSAPLDFSERRPLLK